MSDEQAPQPDPTAPTTTSAPAAASGRTRRWLAGATLVTVGLVAGRASYAFTSTHSDGTGSHGVLRSTSSLRS